MRFFLILRSMALPVITFTRHSRSSILSGGRGLVDKDGQSGLRNIHFSASLRFLSILPGFEDHL